MYGNTKADGLCLYRSLYQLLNLYNCNMDKKLRHNSQLRRITSADVDLTTSIIRDEFVSFLEHILEGRELY